MLNEFELKPLPLSRPSLEENTGGESSSPQRRSMGGWVNPSSREGPGSATTGASTSRAPRRRGDERGLSVTTGGVQLPEFCLGSTDSRPSHAATTAMASMPDQLRLLKDKRGRSQGSQREEERNAALTLRQHRAVVSAGDAPLVQGSPSSMRSNPGNLPSDSIVSRRSSVSHTENGIGIHTPPPNAASVSAWEDIHNSNAHRSEESFGDPRPDPDERRIQPMQQHQDFGALVIDTTKPEEQPRRRPILKVPVSIRKREKPVAVTEAPSQMVVEGTSSNDPRQAASSGHAAEDVQEFGSSPGSERRRRRPAERPVEVGNTTLQYLQWDELQPIREQVNDRWLSDLGKQLSDSSQWSVQFDALNTLRRAAKHSAEAVAPAVRALVAQVIPICESLRSGLAKNALVCLHDLMQNFKRAVDSELETLVPTLLRKAADTSAFISEEAERCLQSMCWSASESRLMGVLLEKLAAQKGSLAKGKVVMCIGMLSERLGSRLASIKEVDKVCAAVASVMSEGSADARTAAKVAAQQVHRALGDDADRIFKRACGEAAAGKVRQAAEKFSGTMTGVQDLKGAHRDGRDEAGSPKPGRKPAKAVSQDTLEAFRALLDSLQVSDWKARVDAIDSVTKFVQTAPAGFWTAGSRALQLTDSLSGRIADSNVKVAVAALNSLSAILGAQPPLLPPAAIQTTVPVLVPAVLQSLASSSPNVRQMCEDVLEVFVRLCPDRAAVVTPFLSVITGSAGRVQCAATERLAHYLPTLLLAKPQAVAKQVLPVGFRLLNSPSTRGEIRTALLKLIRAVEDWNPGAVDEFAAGSGNSEKLRELREKGHLAR